MPESIASQVRRKRARIGITIEDLAGIANVGRRFIVDLESGAAEPNSEEAQRVARALGLRVKGRDDGPR